MIIFLAKSCRDKYLIQSFSMKHIYQYCPKSIRQKRSFSYKLWPSNCHWIRTVKPAIPARWQYNNNKKKTTETNYTYYTTYRITMLNFTKPVVSSIYRPHCHLWMCRSEIARLKRKWRRWQKWIEAITAAVRRLYADDKTMHVLYMWHGPYALVDGFDILARNVYENISQSFYVKHFIHFNEKAFNFWQSSWINWRKK